MKKLLNANVVSILWLLLAGAAFAQQSNGPVLRLDPALDNIVAPDAKVERVLEDYLFLEGPVWVRKPRESGYLVFSDIPANTMHKWDPATGKASLVLRQAGFTGTDASGIGRPNSNGKYNFFNVGSNGITLDRQGRIVFCAMGDRQVVRLEPDGKRTVLASHFEGKRLNSCNDIVVRSDGAVYFTDPPSGLRDGDKDPRKELPFNGIFMIKDGKIQLITKDIVGPNGLAFSPDEEILYLADNAHRLVLRYDVHPDGSISGAKTFVDMNDDKAEGNPDGMKVDTQGNLYTTGAGGIWVVSPQGKHLGKLIFPERPANLAWGDKDGKTLYVTARAGLYRIRMKIPGVMP